MNSGSIADILSKGDIGDGHRSRERAHALIQDFKTTIGLLKSDAQMDRAMQDFIAEAVLGAAWYQHNYKKAHKRTVLYIVLNCAAVIGLPLALVGLSWLIPSDLMTTQVTTQITGILTGVLGLQKTLSAWYASQQRYAAWYKSASDLKTIFYGLVGNWSDKAAQDRDGFRAALAIGAAAARKVISDEQLDYYQKLSLPTFDILDLLTSGQSAVSSLVTRLRVRLGSPIVNYSIFSA
jgi:hypothetical protein